MNPRTLAGKRVVASLFLFIAGAPSPLLAETTTAHVYQAVGELRMELEQIRQVMGKRAPRSREFKLEEAEPRQVFFQAQTLFRKCNQLAQEVAGVSRVQPGYAPEDRAIVPEDVLQLVQASRSQLQHVRTTLGIEGKVDPPRLDRRKKSSDVMHDIIEAGYVLNRLTSTSHDWSQIYDRVYQAVAYLGGALPEATRYPELEPFECCKMPQDVYARMALTMEAARPIADSVDLSLIRITAVKQAEGGASTETVYDLTTTLISDFGELTLRLNGEDISGPEYIRPTRILPSHVFQLAGVLETQVNLLTAN